ncbi:hypothetical protein BY996DRAFT_6414743 [Phakopsora pachyrhizi]|nr:hypothetical protein BY996DRAFT_6414743 [Phakopsora pachyrhizi]
MPKDWYIQSVTLVCFLESGLELPRAKALACKGVITLDSEGLAKFETLYPGQEENRSLHLYAIIRTDWYEHSKNQTVDSDSSHNAAAIVQIFFPDSLNHQVLNRTDYKITGRQFVKNKQDFIFSSGQGVLKAKAELPKSSICGGVQAHVQISVDAHASQNITVTESPYQCKTNCKAYQNTTEQTTTISATSKHKPHFIPLAVIFFASTYVFYG